MNNHILTVNEVLDDACDLDNKQIFQTFSEEKINKICSVDNKIFSDAFNNYQCNKVKGEEAPQDDLVRFYNFEGGVESIKGANVKFNFASEFNDLQEGGVPPLLNKTNLSYLSRLFRFSMVLCFTDSIDNPLMWADYSDSWNGLAIGYKIEDKKKFDSFFTVKVDYYKSDRNIASKIQTIVQNKTSLSNNDMIKLLTVLLCSKFDIWKYENEIRSIIFSIPSCEIGKPLPLWKLEKMKKKTSISFQIKTLKDLGLRISSVYLGCRLYEKISDALGCRLYEKIRDAVIRYPNKYTDLFYNILTIPDVNIYSCSSQYMKQKVLKTQI